jgi:RNA polymerase sigma-70 factor, ECF subfamily
MGERQDEFERVAMPHVASLLRFARRLAANRSAANDLVQETCLRAWRAFDGLRPGSNVRAWLFRILINTSRGEGRKAKRSLELASFCREANPRSMPSVEESVELIDALDALPREQKETIVLVVIEGFTCREVSEILSIPQGTVMSRLSRARQALREELASNYSRVSR